MDSRGSADPHWARVVEIAWQLWTDGIYVVQVDSARTQRFVDVQWAAHQAGRLLGGRAKIETSARGREDPTVTVTVTFVDPGRKGPLRTEQGLERLLHEVRAEDDRHDR